MICQRITGGTLVEMSPELDFCKILIFIINALLKFGATNWSLLSKSKLQILFTEHNKYNRVQYWLKFKMDKRQKISSRRKV